MQADAVEPCSVSQSSVSVVGRQQVNRLFYTHIPSLGSAHTSMSHCVVSDSQSDPEKTGMYCLSGRWWWWWWWWGVGYHPPA